MLNLKNN